MPRAEWPEFGADELDPRAPAPAGSGWWPRRRPALGVGATAAPTFVFVLAGGALGPAGLNLLSRAALGHAQALAWVALAVLGVFVGLGLAAGWSRAPRGTLMSGMALALATSAIVAGGVYLLVGQVGVTLPGRVTAGALLIGLCASVSAAVEASRLAGLAAGRAAAIADRDDDVPLLLFGVATIAALGGGPAVLRLVATVAAGGAVGLAGWLLFERATVSERGLFVTGTILLLAGIGAYLGTSPLVSGCVAAVVWVRAPGTADRLTARDLQILQHPLVALLLVIAGAMIEWTAVVLWLTACVVVLRLAAKLLASLAVGRRTGIPPALLATVLLQPGVMGIALSLNAGMLLGADYQWVVSTVAASTVISELLAAWLPGASQDGE
jgi:hypothetical protein